MATLRSATSADVEALRAALAQTKAYTFGPDDDGYAATIKRWSRAAEKPAGVSIQPTTAEEVSITLKYASQNGIDVAVKGGGHSTAGASSTDGGINIDLARMRNVRVDPEKKLLYVEGGALWHHVDSAAWEHGLATVGGTVADTGVGGLLLGGGYGHLSGKYGLTIDNVVSITTVLANGDIVKASETECPDLFWALRGAGQNFGVATEFVLKAYPQGEAYAGMLLFPTTPEIVEKVVSALNDLFKVRETVNGPKTKAGGRLGSLLAIAKPPPAGGHTMLLLLVAAPSIANEGEGRELLKPFLDIGPVVNTVAMSPYPKVNNLVPTESGFRSSMKGAAFFAPLRPRFVLEVAASFEKFVADVPDAAAGLVAFEFYDAIKVNEFDNGSFANRGYHLNGLVMPSWKDKANDAICRQWARDVSNLFKAELARQDQETNKGVESASRRGKKGATMLYGNYDQYDEISKDVFGDHYEQLQSIKAKYDPKNMFNKLFAITPAHKN
ncbi:hypothetical protein CB0940_10010 [Cercospora beticola]|uniref:FAD-binding PCMH-type domain-containing protein n=1 Tax=Cercospora beticola TaxID=122368 RepID=A0A2G5HJ98_CERBT|nr:hypothetical protein CB0940_10010 [Cercospora beticola]PIA92283.1 hypothetical protein CB0940_10010 [Cercospora beticola]WPB05635.1 hypothetical protein RHO25_010288 [Cercospora beticola]